MVEYVLGEGVEEGVEILRFQLLQLPQDVHVELRQDVLVELPASHE